VKALLFLEARKLARHAEQFFKGFACVFRGFLRNSEISFSIRQLLHVILAIVNTGQLESRTFNKHKEQDGVFELAKQSSSLHISIGRDL
jgi:hypothetical protein